MAGKTLKLMTVLALGTLTGVSALGLAPLLQAQERGEEPIAYVGHGAMFDARGNQIIPTETFMARAQTWYRAKLLSQADDKVRAEFAAFERKLTAGVKASGQARLVIQQRLLDWLRARVPGAREDQRLGSKLGAMRYQLTWKLPPEGQRLEKGKFRGLWDGGPFELPDDLKRKLDLPEFKPGGVVFLSTMNAGQAYIDECAANQVPIPPTINQMDPSGTNGWKIQGSIPGGDQFIVGSPAEVRTFENDKGMCIALPRFNASKTTVALDGVICLSKITSKVCFWDNQKGGATFSFPAGQKIPIGVPNAAIDPMMRYQGGGAELTDPDAGMCTDCHAGENPYIVHPDSELKPGLAFGDLKATLPMFAPNRYDPIVLASWPQNAASTAFAYAPSVCRTCHVKGNAGRFPLLSNELQGYCNTILAQAVVRTMPPGAPGSQSANSAVTDFQAMCSDPPDSNAADTGDPHLRTVNGINYDFQSAGEFTALRNSDSGFELQTRQTPVTTTFVPGTNPYTGLQSCVSLNTAAAFRLGKRRVSYQPGERQRMEVRVDGKLVTLTGSGISLGGGNKIAASAAGGGIDVTSGDGTRVIITPNFWSSQGYWYLNVDVLKTPALEGTMGYILAGHFLPLAPDGSSFGPKPAALNARWTLLNQKFAGAWRVTPTTSLFDYAPGTSPATFADPAWPPKPGAACKAPAVPSIPRPGGPTIRPLDQKTAVRVCRPVIKDKMLYEACVFDVMAMGDTAVGEAYQRMLAARLAAP